MMLPSPAPRARTGPARMQLPSPPSSSAADDSDHYDDDGDGSTTSSGPLPFPSALPRDDFRAPDFDPAAYLSALHAGGPGARHQTLDDLRSELRERRAAVGAELLALVNANYAAFLGLGDGLRGGEDRAEDLRVGLLGFRRGVEEVVSRVRERREEVGVLSGELRGVRAAVETGRRMLELDERVAGLEGKLAVGGGYGGEGRPGGDGEEDGWEEFEDSEEEGEGEDGDEGFLGSSPAKLNALAKDYGAVEQLADAIGRDLPFVKQAEERMARCRNTILLDLGTALREARRTGPRGQTRTLKLLGVYRTLQAESEAVRVLKAK